MFTAHTYKTRRDRLRTLMANAGFAEGKILVLGNRESPKNYADNGYDFRQDSSFLYLFGHQVPGMAGTIDLATGTSALYGEPHSIDDEIWTGPLPSLDKLAEDCGAEAARPRAALKADLGPFARRGPAAPGGVHYVGPYRDSQRLELVAALGEESVLTAAGSAISPAALAAAANSAPPSLGCADILSAAEALASRPLMEALSSLREVKEACELAELDKAADASAEMHRAVIRLARPGMREYELRAAAAGLAHNAGGGLAFPVIATTRGSVLHNHSYGARLAPGGLFLLDTGAETAEGYAGDLTSTFPISGAFDGRQRAIYDIVLAGASAAVAILKPGLPFLEAHLAAARAMAEGLKELGLMRGDLDEAVAAGAHALFFPHGLGHMIGLDVHDMENYGEVLVGYAGKPKSSQFGLRSLRLGKPLAEGMAHSVEPGIYFIEALAEKWRAERLHEAYIDYAEVEKWYGFGGVRNEECRVTTATGSRKLGAAFDKSPAAIEALRKG